MKKVICIGRRIFISAAYPFVEFTRDTRQYAQAQRVKGYRDMTLFLLCGEGR